MSKGGRDLQLERAGHMRDARSDEQVIADEYLERAGYMRVTRPDEQAVAWVPCDVYFQHGVKVAGSPFIRLDADRHGAEYNEAMGLIRFTHVADRASMSIHHPSGPVVKERKAVVG